MIAVKVEDMQEKEMKKEVKAFRMKFYKHLEMAFKDIIPKSFQQYYEEYK